MSPKRYMYRQNVQHTTVHTHVEIFCLIVVITQTFRCISQLQHQTVAKISKSTNKSI